MSQYCGEDLSIKYERNNNISYAVVDITDSNELVEYEMKMLMRNRPDYFLQFSINEINSRKCIYIRGKSREEMVRSCKWREIIVYTCFKEMNTDRLVFPRFNQGYCVINNI